MGAEITWFPPAPEGPRRVGAIRYGAAFESSGARHGYDGCGVTQDWGDGIAAIGPLGSQLERGETRPSTRASRGAQDKARRRRRFVWRIVALLLSWALGRPPEFSRQDWRDILAAHEAEGFRRVEFERHGSLFYVDLRFRPWRMRRVG